MTTRPFIQARFHNYHRLILGLLASVAFTNTAHAQITKASAVNVRQTPVPKLEDQLINRLRATQPQQQSYLRFVANLVDQKKLDLRLVVALQQYAVKRNSQFPFPFFERALFVEAGKRGVVVPSVRTFVSTADSD
jgi:hypothetical protein